MMILRVTTLLIGKDIRFAEKELYDSQSPFRGGQRKPM